MLLTMVIKLKSHTKNLVKSSHNSTVNPPTVLVQLYPTAVNKFVGFDLAGHQRTVMKTPEIKQHLMENEGITYKI